MSREPERRRPGRPASGKRRIIPARLEDEVIAALDKFVDGDAIPTRSEAIRHILRDWLKSNQML